MYSKPNRWGSPVHDISSLKHLITKIFFSREARAEVRPRHIGLKQLRGPVDTRSHAFAARSSSDTTFCRSCVGVEQRCATFPPAFIIRRPSPTSRNVQERHLPYGSAECRAVLAEARTTVRSPSLSQSQPSLALRIPVVRLAFGWTFPPLFSNHQ